MTQAGAFFQMLSQSLQSCHLSVTCRYLEMDIFPLYDLQTLQCFVGEWNESLPHPTPTCDPFIGLTHDSLEASCWIILCFS